MARNRLHQPAPTRANYAEWYAARQQRAAEFIAAGGTRISGYDIRAKGISMKALYDAGFTLNDDDWMVKNG